MLWEGVNIVFVYGSDDRLMVCFRIIVLGFVISVNCVEVVILWCLILLVFYVCVDVSWYI